VVCPFLSSQKIVLLDDGFDHPENVLFLVLESLIKSGEVFTQNLSDLDCDKIAHDLIRGSLIRNND